MLVMVKNLCRIFEVVEVTSRQDECRPVLGVRNPAVTNGPFMFVVRMNVHSYTVGSYTSRYITTQLS